MSVNMLCMSSCRPSVQLCLCVSVVTAVELFIVFLYLSGILLCLSVSKSAMSAFLPSVQLSICMFVCHCCCWTINCLFVFLYFFSFSAHLFIISLSSFKIISISVPVQHYLSVQLTEYLSISLHVIYNKMFFLWVNCFYIAFIIVFEIKMAISS